MLRFMRVPAVIGALVLLLLAVIHAAADAPGNPAFQARWERTDDPVLNGQVARTWIWGPEANTAAMTEPYAESPGGTRQVQYFDKSRMEINNPSGDPDNLFYVTNGLLVVELMTGNLQLGDNTFEHHNPAIVNVAGDADDSTGPTYVTLAALRGLPPLGDNSLITQRVNRAGQVTDDQTLASQNIRTAQRLTVPGIDHQIAAPFWTFMNSSGLVKVDGSYENEALFTNPYYATGYPITEAYWATVKVAGTYRDVLMQCFERRCLTYTPGNPDGFATEAGNVGQHYHTWRYVQIPGEGQPTATSTTTGGPTATSPSEATATSTGQATATSTSMAPTATSTAIPVTDYVYTTQFGQATDAANDMQSPAGVAVDADGNLYVADLGAARVQKFDRTGVLLGQFGGPGQDGELNAPVGLAIDSTGTVWVVDRDEGAVETYDANGNYITRVILTGFGTPDAVSTAPTDIAFDSDGNVYVVDSANARVEVFDSTGQYLRSWGGLGSENGEFDLPHGIAIDANDDVYVTDENNNRVQVFDTMGNFLRKWGTPGEDDNTFNDPYGISIAPDTNQVYVTELGNDRVQVFTTSGEFVAAWGEVGSGPGQFANPEDVVTGPGLSDGDEQVYVADAANGRVQIFLQRDRAYLGKIDGDSGGRFTAGGADGLAINPTNGDIVVIDYAANLVKTFRGDRTFTTEWGDIALDPLIPLDNPNDVAIGANGLLYIADGNNNRIVVFDAAGVQQNAWGSTGTGDSEFEFPTGVSIDGAGNVYVVDAVNQRIQKFNADGQYLDQWGTFGSGDGQFKDPIGIDVTQNRVYVVDTGNNRVQMFDLDGNYLDQFGSTGSRDGELSSPWRIASDSAGYIYVTDPNNARVEKFTPDGDYLAQFGTAGSNDGQFSLPTGIVVSINGDIFVADANNARVQVFSPAP